MQQNLINAKIRPQFSISVYSAHGTFTEGNICLYNVKFDDNSL